MQNKFKKEEKTNAWRVDKALRESFVPSGHMHPYYVVKIIVNISSISQNQNCTVFALTLNLENKRPFDNEFFSFLLKRVLEKDKKRGKSIKLVVKPNKANKGKGNALPQVL